jgi:hypothetical protein
VRETDGEKTKEKERERDRTQKKKEKENREKKRERNTLSHLSLLFSSSHSALLPNPANSSSLRLQALNLRGPLGQASYRLSSLPAAIVVVNPLHFARVEYVELELPEVLSADSSIQIEDASGR